MPPSACSNQPLRRVCAPVKAPGLVAEELRVDQLGGDRAAVHAAERPAAKRRVLVDGARDDLLAGARFAEEQHRRVAARHEPRARHHRGQSGVAANQTFFAGARVAVNQALGAAVCRACRCAVSVTYDR